MRSSFLLTLVFSMALVAASTCQASILGQLLTFNGEINFLNDNSAGVIRDTNSDGTPDLIQGIVWIDSVGSNPVFAATGGSLFAAYSFDLTPTATTVFGGAGFTASASVANPVEALLMGSGSADFSSLNTRTAGIDPGVVVFETTGSYSDANWRNVGGAGAPLSFEFEASPGVWSDDFSPFDVVMTLGFDAVDDYHDIQLLLPAVPLGVFSGVYTVSEDVFSAGVGYKPLTNAFGGIGDVIIEDGNIASPTVNGGNTRGFDFSDGGTYMVATTPEPASLVVWTGLLGGMGFVARRRLARS